MVSMTSLSGNSSSIKISKSRIDFENLTSQNAKSVKEQIQNYLQNFKGVSGVSVVQLGNLTVVDELGNRTTVLNYAQHNALGRQKLLKFLRSVPGLKFKGTGIDSTVTFSTPSSSTTLAHVSSSSAILSTPISAFMQQEKLTLKKSLSKEYLEFMSPPLHSLKKLNLQEKTHNFPAISHFYTKLQILPPRNLSGSLPSQAHWFQPAKLVEFQR